MAPTGYRSFCKERQKDFSRRPNYPHFSDAWMPSMAAGAVIGLVLGIWKNFFPLPEGAFDTVGAVMFTLVYTMGGSCCGLICALLVHWGRVLVVRLRHNAAITSATRRLAENPLVAEVLRCVREESIRGIIITERCIRLYDRIWDERYCESEKDSYPVISEVGLDQMERNYQKREHWAVYDGRFIRELSFAAAGYERMDGDTQMVLANYLRAQLGEWGAASHRAWAFYKSVSGGGFNGTFTYNRNTGVLTAGRYPSSVDEVARELYSDYFLYSLADAYAMAQNRRRAEAEAPQQMRW